MADQGAAQPPVQAEERHQVDRGEGLGGGGVEIVAVPCVKAEVAHEVGEEPGVDVLGPARAELVELHRHHRRLGPSAQPGNDPQMRIGLLEVVQGAHGGVLAQLPQFALPLEVVADAVAVVPDGFELERVHRPRHVVAARAAVPAHGVQEEVLGRAAHAEQGGIPLQALVHPGEPPVVELVQDVEEQVEVVPVRVGAADRGGVGQPEAAPHQHADDALAQRAACGGERGAPGVVGCRGGPVRRGRHASSPSWSWSWFWFWRDRPSGRLSRGSAGLRRRWLVSHQG